MKHHGRLPYRELPAFMRRLRERDGVEARALEFVILTAARAGEAVAADWSEIDWADGGTWIVPPERMKARREHRSLVEGGARGAGTDDRAPPAGARSSPMRPGRQPVTVIGLWRLTRIDRRPGHHAWLSKHVP